MVRNIFATSSAQEPVAVDACTDLRALAQAVGQPLLLARLLTGDRETAAEMLRRMRSACAERGIKYDRRKAIESIAGYLKLPANSLANWLNRARGRQQI